MRAPAIAWLALCLLSLPASAMATGGIWCDADDANLGFRFKAVQSRDGTGGWFGIEGRLVTKAGTLPKHLSSFDVTQDTLTQRWFGAEGVLLQVQKYAAEPFESVMLTIATKPADEGSYTGTYELRITSGGDDASYVTRRGKVSCGAD